MAKSGTKKVFLDKPMTYAGTTFAPGTNEMPAKAADYAIKRKFGRAVGGGAAELPADFKPLSLEETMKRFAEGDSSEEVFQSLKFHQSSIAQGMRSGEPRNQTITRVDSQSGGAGNGAATSGVGADGGYESTEGNSGSNSSTTSETGGEKGKSNELPEDFPMKHVFEREGFKSVAEVHAKTREELIAIDGIAEKTADKALDYGK